MARRRSGKKIDNLRWVGVFAGFLGQAAGASGLTALSATTMPDTIMRTRGTLTAWIDVLQAPAVAARVSIGLVKVPEGTGTTVLWSPFADTNAPWFWFTLFVLGYEEYVTDVVDCPGITSYREIIDSKVMRRVRPDEEVQLVIENTTFAGAVGVNVQFAGRVLLGS